MTLSRRMALVAVLMLATSLAALAQPRIAYIIPDLGTTRFATYVEMIGPSDAIGNFGNDGIYDNRPSGAVRVRPLRPADSLYIKVGPCIVSWNGRMISTQIFVTDKAVPNSDNWNLLDPTWRIPIVAEINGQVSAADTFYIVKPYKMGDKRADVQSVLGAGTLGMRSRRGAMLIDSMILPARRTYTVSTADCDPFSPGNQGYLPFTLIAVDSIIGADSTHIRVDAQGANGGPGGGGGGGGYANGPQLSGAKGEAGGKGFTGGGPGGYNNSGSAILGPSSRRQPGVGSGDSLVENINNTIGGRALNGQQGGTSTVAFESAGGGTGHPFGGSGQGCDGRSTCSAPGGYGGGSGGRDNKTRSGGGGGYGSDGVSDPGMNNGGKAHGNICIVPLAGGSGGASGNPEGLKTVLPPIGEISSSGGGGGGAIAIHGKLVANLSVYALGVSAAKQDVRGGAGSGGGLIIGTRMDNAVGNRFITGQAYSNYTEAKDSGGTGRKRYDSRVGTSPSYFVGPVTDTITAALRTFELFGSGNGQEMEIWVASDRQPWQKLATVTDYTLGYRQSITLPGTDILYYIVTIQKMPNPGSGAYDAVPTGVMSQSAWNIIRIFGPPVIAAQKTRNLGVYRCPGTVVLDTIEIRNEGESPLEIQTPTWQNNNGFRVVSPVTFPDTVDRFSSKKYIVEYIPAAGVTGVVNNTLVLDNNDTARARNPFQIAYTITVDPIKLQYQWNGRTVDTVDLKQVCLGSNVQERIVLKNAGSIPFVVSAVRSLNPSVVDAGGVFPAPLAPFGEEFVTIGGTIRTLGTIVVPVLVSVQDCPEPDTLFVRLTSVEARLVSVGSTQFGNVAVNATRSQLVELRNDGSADLIIASLPAVNPPFRIVSATPSPTTTLKPGASMILEVEYAPTQAGDDSATMIIGTESSIGSCPDTVVLALAGRGVEPALTSDKQALLFGDVQACTGARDSVIFTNTGTAPITVLYPAFLNGPDAAAFTIISQPTVDITLAPGEKVSYVVEAKGSASAGQVQTAILSVRTNSSQLAQLDIPLSARHVALAFTGPSTADAGTVVVGQTGQVTVRFTNTTAAPVTITAVRSSLPVFTVSPQTATVAAGDPQDFTIDFAAAAEGPVTATVWIVFGTPCVDSIAITVRGEGKAGTISYPNALPFGVLVNCEARVDSVVYVNTSGVATDLVDVAISGPDQALFTILNPIPATGITMQPDDRVVLRIQFDPRQNSDGFKSATLLARMRSNNQLVTLVTQLSGTRRTSLPSTPVQVSFGAIDIGSVTSQVVSIVNTTDGPVHIVNIGMRNSSGGVITFTGPAPPLTLQPGDRLDVRVLFAPDAQADYVDSLVLAFDQPCSDERVIPVRGVGRLNLEVTVSLPELIVDPANDNQTLEVKTKMAVGTTNITNGLLRMTIRYDGSVFLARTITPGTIIGNTIVGGLAFLDVEIPGVNVTSEEQVVARIQGQNTLGVVDSTALEITSATLTATGLAPVIRPDNGFLKLEICEEGGLRLVTRAGQLLLGVRPNPAVDAITIDADVYETGSHRIDVVTLTGDVVATEIWNHVRGASPRQLRLDANALPAGSYQVVLTTPSRRRLASFSIIH